MSADNKGEMFGTAQACSTSDYPSNVPETQIVSGSNGSHSGSKTLGSEDDRQEQTNINFAPLEQTNHDYLFEKFEQLRSQNSVTENSPQVGKVLITATSNNEESKFENDEVMKEHNLTRKPLPNSYFTYYFTKGLDKFNGQTFKAFDYAQIRTRSIVAQVFRATQTPEMIGTPSQCLNINLKK